MTIPKPSYLQGPSLDYADMFDPCEFSGEPAFARTSACCISGFASSDLVAVLSGLMRYIAPTASATAPPPRSISLDF